MAFMGSLPAGISPVVCPVLAELPLVAKASTGTAIVAIKSEGIIFLSVPLVSDVGEKAWVSLTSDIWLMIGGSVASVAWTVV